MLISLKLAIQIMSEYIHRLFASLVTILLISSLFLAFYHRNDVTSDKEKIGYKRLQIMVLTIIILFIQVIFGGLTVLLGLQPAIVSLHLGFATLIFGGTIFHVSWIKV